MLATLPLARIAMADKPKEAKVWICHVTHIIPDFSGGDPLAVGREIEVSKIAAATHVAVHGDREYPYYMELTPGNREIIEDAYEINLGNANAFFVMSSLP